jgi:outer membrane protein TolC
VISLPIFAGGRLRGRLQLRKAQQMQAAIAYRRTLSSNQPAALLARNDSRCLELH